MKKYTMTCTLMFIPAMVIGMGVEMYNPSPEMEQIRMEAVRRIFGQRKIVKANLERNRPTDDAMSLSRSSSGSFPIDIPKVQKQDSSRQTY